MAEVSLVMKKRAALVYTAYKRRRLELEWAFRELRKLTPDQTLRLDIRCGVFSDRVVIVGVFYVDNKPESFLLPTFEPNVLNEMTQVQLGQAIQELLDNAVGHLYRYCRLEQSLQEQKRRSER